MLVRNVMSKRVVTVTAEDILSAALARMVEHRVSGLPVVDDLGRLVGVLSEGDLLRRVELGTLGGLPWFTDLFRPGHQAKLYARTRGTLVHQVMSRTPRTIQAAAGLEDAVRLMEEHRVKRLPVMEGDRLVGIITRADFVRVLAGLLAAPYEEPATCDAEIEALILAELGRQPWARGAAIRVVVRDRLVSLSGGICDERQRGAVQALAGAVPGVRSVEAGGLRLDSRADLPDSAIAHAEEW